MLRGDRGITYANAVPAGSRIVAGQWWSADYSGEPLVSLESRTAHDLDLKIGDTITVNVLGRNVTARIANLRAVDWENLGINFVLVFSPGTFDGAPHTDIATLTFADGGTTAEETAVIKALADAFPTVTAVRVKDALDAVDALVGKLVLALRGASSITLIAAALVLGGALAAGQRFRIYDAVVLKTLGATRARLTAAYAIEYLLIGLATVVFGVAAGSLAADLVVTRVMDFPFVWVAGEAVGDRRGCALRHRRRSGLPAPSRRSAASPPKYCGISDAPRRQPPPLSTHERFVTLAKYGVAPIWRAGRFRTRFLPRSVSAFAERQPRHSAGTTQGYFHVRLRSEFRNRQDRLSHGPGRDRCGSARAHDPRLQLYGRRRGADRARGLADLSSRRRRRHPSRPAVRSPD